GGSGAGMGGRGFVEDGASLLVAPTPATRLTGRVGRSTDTARIDCGSGGSAATALLKDCASSPADCGRLTGDFSSADRITLSSDCGLPGFSWLGAGGMTRRCK